MGIKFNCPACGRPLNVKSELAGKRGRCPKCQAKIDIPAEGADSDTAAATGLTGGAGAGPPGAAAPAASSAAAPSGPGVSSPVGGEDRGRAAGFVAVEEQTKTWTGPPAPAADPISEAPTLQWYAMPPGATNQYGPVTGEEFRVWLKEGRVPADALVWRQDWPDWKRAAAVFPQLATPAGAPGAPCMPTAAPGMPALGPPVAQPAFPLPGPAPGMLPAGQTSAPLDDAFPVMPTEPPKVTRGATSRGRGYRPRSNTRPIIAIVVLLLALIPLTFFVWKVVTDQVSPAPPRATSAGSTPEAGSNPETDDTPEADDAAGSNEEEE